MSDSSAVVAWEHKNGRTYRRRLRASTFVIPKNCVKVWVEQAAETLLCVRCSGPIHRGSCMTAARIERERTRLDDV